MPLRLHTILLTALLAGLLAGTAFFATQLVTTRPLIAMAEIAERAQAGAMPSHQPDLDHAAMAEGWKPADGTERTAYTLGADLLIGVAYAFLLMGVISLSGRRVSILSGIAWGAAGFVAFVAAPSLGLPPEPPGVQGAELLARQEWWLMASVATAAGLCLLLLQPRPWLRLAGLALLLLPHLIGAPRSEAATAAAPELLSPFIWASLCANAVLWVALGLAIGALLPLLRDDRPSGERATA